MSSSLERKRTPLQVGVDLFAPRFEGHNSEKSWLIGAHLGYSPDDVDDVRYGISTESLKKSGMRVVKESGATNMFGESLPWRIAQAVFSGINPRPKQSGIADGQAPYYKCTGVYAQGIDGASGEPISFLTHQAPQVFVPGKDLKHFVQALSDTLSDLFKRSSPGSVDALIVGGLAGSPDVVYKHGEPTYRGMRDILGKTIRRVLKTPPLVISANHKDRTQLIDDWSVVDSMQVFADTPRGRMHVRSKPGVSYAFEDIQGTFSVSPWSSDS